jgi:hypothetical protein
VVGPGGGGARGISGAEVKTACGVACQWVPGGEGAWESDGAAACMFGGEGGCLVMADRCDIEGNGASAVVTVLAYRAAAKLIHDAKAPDRPRNNTHDTPPFDLKPAE